MPDRTNYRYIAPADPEGEPVCGLTRETARQRLESPEDFFAAAKSQEVLPSGYELRFGRGGGMPGRIDTFIREEQVCCPFFAFEQWTEGRELVLRILQPQAGGSRQ